MVKYELNIVRERNFILLNSLGVYIKNMHPFFKILWVILLLWVIWEIIQYFRRKQTATALDKEDFKKNIRRAQLIDVRNRDEYDVGHILGARNIPYFDLKQRYVELRKDQPIYLYEEREYTAYRAAIELKKHGFDDLYVLKGGYDDWDGRIKRNKKID